MVVLKALQNTWTPIGVDVGARGARMVQARRVGDRHTIVAAAQCERAAPVERDLSEQAPQLLAECLEKSRFRGRAAVAALMTPDIEYHSLDLPAAALQADADQVVRFEVQRLMTDPPENFETRHWLLPRASASGPNTLAVGAPREIIHRMLTACASAGLACSCVDAAGLALVRFALRLQSWPAGTVWGVLDVGERRSRLILCVDECPVLVRAVGTGGHIWTQRIADALQLSFKAAEVHKRTHGIALAGIRESGVAARSTPSEARPANPGLRAGVNEPRSELASMLLGALRLDLNDLAGEVKRSYEYVLGCYPKCRAADLVLVGGGAGLRNLPEHLGQALGIRVRRASEYLNEPGCRLAFTGSQREPMEAYALATGLTIRG